MPYAAHYPLARMSATAFNPCAFHNCRNATRGDKRMYVSSTTTFSVNAWVRLLMDNVNNGLVADLHSGLVTPDTQFLNKNDIVVFNFQITEVSCRTTSVVQHSLYPRSWQVLNLQTVTCHGTSASLARRPCCCVASSWVQSQASP